jgi:hypothetical protein
MEEAPSPEKVCVCCFSNVNVFVLNFDTFLFVQYFDTTCLVNNAMLLLCPPVRPPRPPLVSYEAIVEGFAEPRRNFELPGRMSLSNMVSVLVDVWELED